MIKSRIDKVNLLKRIISGKARVDELKNGVDVSKLSEQPLYLTGGENVTVVYPDKRTEIITNKQFEEIEKSFKGTWITFK